MSAPEIAMPAAGLVVTAAFAWYLARVAKRELDKQRNQGPAGARGAA